MTETERQTLKIIVAITAMRAVMRECLVEMAASFPNGACRTRQALARLRTRPPALGLNGIDPALSQLAAHEYQDALNELLSFIESGLRNELGSQAPHPAHGQPLAN